MFESEQEQPQNNFQETSYNFRDFPELKLIDNDEDILKEFKSKFEEGSDIHKYYSFLVNNFGKIVDKEEIDKVCTGENLLGVDPWGKYPNAINDVIYHKDFLIYKIPHHDQMILAKKFDDGEVLLLPDRRVMLIEALSGMDEDDKFMDECRKMMSVKVRGEKLKPVLSKKELGLFAKMLSGSVLEKYNGVTSLNRKIHIQKSEDVFKIIKSPNNKDDEFREYYFETIMSKRGLDFSE